MSQNRPNVASQDDRSGVERSQPQVASGDGPSSVRDDATQVSKRPAAPLPDMVIIYDSPQACPYLDGRVARMPLNYPRGRVSSAELDGLLASGYRRTGAMFYKTQCPRCRECVPVRVDVQTFQLSRSMRRIVNRGNRELTIRMSRPNIDADRLKVFNDHRVVRCLTQSGSASLQDYYEFLVATSVESYELSFWLRDELVGVAIFDLGVQSINAVYTHFSPQHARFSIGTLAVLKQIELAQQSQRRYVYLGLYVAENRHLNYKRRFRPQERLVGRGGPIADWQVVEP